MNNSVDLTIDNLVEKGIFEWTSDICPRCKGHMLRHIPDDPAIKTEAVCPNCGITENGIELTGGIDVASIDQHFLKQQQVNVWNGVIKSSVTTTNPKVVFSKRFENFEASSEQAKKIGNQAFIYSQEMVKNKLHIMLMGNTGTGKTHLAVAMMWNYLMSGEPNKRGILVNLSDYIALKKLAMNEQGHETQQLINKTDRLIKKADVVILDDVGAERGDVNNATVATDFESSTLLQIINAREDKRLIITTNLSSEQLGTKYDQRTYSRLVFKSKGLEFNLPDYRITAEGM